MKTILITITHCNTHSLYICIDEPPVVDDADYAAAWGLLNTVKIIPSDSTAVFPDHVTLRGGGYRGGRGPQAIIPWACIIPRQSLSPHFLTAVHGIPGMAPVDVHLGASINFQHVGLPLIWRLVTGRVFHRPSEMTHLDHYWAGRYRSLNALVAAHAIADPGMVSAVAKSVINHIQSTYSLGHVITADVYPFYAALPTFLHANDYNDELAMVVTALVSCL